MKLVHNGNAESLNISPGGSQAQLQNNPLPYLEYADVYNGKQTCSLMSLAYKFLSPSIIREAFPIHVAHRLPLYANSAGSSILNFITWPYAAAVRISSLVNTLLPTQSFPRWRQVALPCFSRARAGVARECCSGLSFLSQLLPPR